ncbi:hypothetical protein [Micromonospora sp. LOL_023]|uniref:hypothetical protein n=1 Tax=Micromonospora sp. LOL_023 TaxID=3345418 RepID=UPI003A8862F0
MHPNTAIAGRTPAAPTSTVNSNSVPTVPGVSVMHLLYEALSRTRMQPPQAGTARTEATRPARIVAMQARHRWAGILGGR